MAASRIHVAVLFGGRNSEHEVSCRSAESILANLDRHRYRVTPVRITRDGYWSVDEMGQSTETSILHSLFSAIEVLRTVDVVFPVLHGPNGEDGTVQSVLRSVDVPFVGSGVLASASGMDKEHTKTLLAAEGVPVATGVVLRSTQQTVSEADKQHLGLPVFVKPARAGSSVGVSRVDDWGQLSAAVALARRSDPKVLVETAVLGKEIDIGVLEMPDGELRVSPPLEISVGATQRFFDYDAKYGDPGTRFEIPARIDAETTRRLEELARTVFAVLGCSGLLRIDCFVDGAGIPVVNEVNTLPGFTVASQYPRMWQAADVEYSQLLDILVQTALRGREPLRGRRTGLAADDALTRHLGRT